MRRHDPSQSGVGREMVDHLSRKTLRASVGLPWTTALILIGAGLVLSWLVVHLAGGAGSMVPHWYYIPILFAATRFGPLAALIVAVVAGVLAGPLTFEAVAGGIPQEAGKWLTRAGFFIGIGQVSAWLLAPAMRPLGDEVRRIRWEHEIRRGLAQQEFYLLYQPLYSIRDRRYTGVEALIRWRHPARGELSPAHFIEIAEDSSLIHEFGDFVIETACRQASEWRALAIDQHRPHWYVAINLSARDLERPELAQNIVTALERYNLPPDMLHIELTESVLVTEGAAFQMRQLKKLGVKLAIDDFGSGYSSLSYLNRLPVDVLKVDRSMIVDLGSSSSSHALARGMVMLAGSLGLQTVAEGVETREQLSAVRGLNFDFVQGYYFARPQHANQIPGLLLTHEVVELPTEERAGHEQGSRKPRKP